MELPSLNKIKEIAGGDHTFESQLIDVIKKELPEEIISYKKSLEESQFIETASEVHKLKHKISILGLEKGYQIADDFENELKGNSIRLQDQFNAILEQMIAFIHKL